MVICGNMSMLFDYLADPQELLNSDFEKLSPFIDIHVTVWQARNDNFKRPRFNGFTIKLQLESGLVCIGKGK